MARGGGDLVAPEGLSTPALLSLLLAGTGARSEQIDFVAAQVDGGPRRSQRGSAGSTRLSAAAGQRLALSLEFARRVVARPRPEVLRGPDDVAALAERLIGGRTRETVLVIVCDAANRPIDELVVATGSVDRVTFPVREILHAVLRADGRAFAVAHNHPSGDPEFSSADDRATRDLEQAARAVGLRFLGHVVV